jgi:hypothetical protein
LLIFVAAGRYPKQPDRGFHIPNGGKPVNPQREKTLSG